MAGSTFFEPHHNSQWFRDIDYRLCHPKRYDETLVFDADKPLWDLTDDLESGETISSATYSASNGLGVASTGEGNSTCYATITKTGSVEITATTSEGRIFQQEFCFIGTDQPLRSDYP